MKYIIAVVLIILLLVGAQSFLGEQAESKEQSPAPVSETKIQEEVIVEGIVAPSRDLLLKMVSNSTVEEINVEIGDRVEVNAPILMLNSERAEALLRQRIAGRDAAKARLDEVKAGARDEEVEAMRAKCEVTRIQRNRLPDEAAEEDKEIATAELRACESQLALLEKGARPETIKAVEAELAGAEAMLREAEKALDEMVLRAPCTCVVADLKIEVGEQVTPGVPVVQLIDLSSGWVVQATDLGELDVVRVHPGDKVKVRFDSLPDVELDGVVERVGIIGQERAGDTTFDAEIRLDNQDERLRGNLTAAITIFPESH